MASNGDKDFTGYRDRLLEEWQASNQYVDESGRGGRNAEEGGLGFVGIGESLESVDSATMVFGGISP